MYSIESYGGLRQWFAAAPQRPRAAAATATGGNRCANSLSILGFMPLPLDCSGSARVLGVIHWPQSSFMINQIEWAGYGAALGAVGLILIWQSQR